MSAATASSAKALPAGASLDGYPLKATWWHVLRSEWIKLRSLRSTWWALAITVVLMVGLSAVSAQLLKNHPIPPGTPTDGLTMSGASVTVGGMQTAQLVVIVLGVLATAGEYSNGMIRTTFSAVRSRLSVLFAKAVVIGVTVFVVTAPATFLAFYVGQWILGDGSVSINADGVLRSLLGQACYLTGVALLGAAAGALVRSTAGSLASLLGVLFVVPGVLQLILPSAWVNNIVPYTPSWAGSSFAQVTAATGSLSWKEGALVFAIWVIGLFVAAAIALKRRDA